MTKMVGSAALAVIAVIAITMAVSPAHAMGGPRITAKTAELLPVAGLTECEAESFDGMDCNANANVQRTFYNLMGQDPQTQFAAIAENLLYDPVNYAVVYGLIILRNEYDMPIADLGDEDCNLTSSHFIGYVPIDINGKLAEPKDFGLVKMVFESDVVFLCRLIDVEGAPLLDNGEPRLILSGTFARGAKGGGKDKNRKNQ